MRDASTLPRRMTVDEWAALPEDEPGELVEGVLVEEEMPGLAHESVVIWLSRTLDAWVEPRGGFVFGSEAKLALGTRRGRKPDLTLYLPGRGPLPAEDAVRLPPDVSVEVVSQTPVDVRRDRVEKARDYAAFGGRWCWLVDYGRRTLEILELGQEGRYAPVLTASAGVLASVPGCEGLVLDLDALWRRLDRLGDSR